jgi:hypothetical protein
MAIIILDLLIIADYGQMYIWIYLADFQFDELGGSSYVRR